MGFPCGSAGKESTCNEGESGFDRWIGKIPWRRERLPTPVFWPREFRGLYSPWARKQSDTTEWFSHYLYIRKQRLREMKWFAKITKLGLEALPLLVTLVPGWWFSFLLQVSSSCLTSLSVSSASSTLALFLWPQLHWAPLLIHFSSPSPRSHHDHYFWMLWLS